MKTIRNVKKIFSELNYVLTSKQKSSAVLVLFVAIISSFMELLGVSVIIPFVEAVTNPDDLLNKSYIILLRKYVSISSTKNLLIIIGIGIIIIYLIKNIFMIISYYVQYTYASKISMDLSVKMLSSYMKRPYEYFLDINSAEIIRGCSNDTDGVYVMIYDIIQVFTELLSIIMISAFLIYTDFFIACSIMCLLGIVMFFMSYSLRPVFKRMGKKQMKAYTEKNKTLYQMTSGIKELFVTQRKDLFEKEYIVASKWVCDINKKRNTLNSSPDRITEGICVSGIIGIIVIRLLLNDDSMEIFIPKLAAFAMAAFKIFPSAGKITSRVNMIIYYMPSLDNVYKNYLSAEENIYKEEINTVSLSQTTNGEKNLEFNDCIRVSSVKWKYKSATVEALRDLSVEINKGESVGLIGPSGSGKTTLSDIILGLLHPQVGTVTVDGVDIFSIPKQWAKIVGYVPQSVFLIDDTVRNNVLFGLKDNDDGAVWRALEQAQLRSFVESLPDGLDTIVGERGVKFSGGQRQRIAIARALYQQPQILVLDEATAALDNETENAVMEAIESLQGTITMIIVAHRLTTIRKCDKVYEIKDGVATLIEKEKIIG